MMRDAQTAELQTFRTGDGWFVYNLATNLAQMSRGRPHWHDTVPFLRRARRLWKYGVPSLAPRPSRTTHRPSPGTARSRTKYIQSTQLPGRAF